MMTRKDHNLSHSEPPQPPHEAKGHQTIFVRKMTQELCSSTLNNSLPVPHAKREPGK